MAQTLNQEEVLIARNNETGQVGAVTGLNEDGTPKMTDVKSAKLSDLVKFSKGQNPLEAFMSNFVRQCKNPSTFGFFRVPADRYDTVGTVIGDFAKDPVANAEMLKNNVVEVPQASQDVEQKVEQSAQSPKQDTNSAENAEAPEKEARHSAIDESKIDWDNLKEKWGIDRAELEKSGDLKEMLYNRKSRLVTVTPTFAGEKFPIDARLSFRTDPDGNVMVVPISSTANLNSIKSLRATNSRKRTRPRCARLAILARWLSSPARTGRKYRHSSASTVTPTKSCPSLSRMYSSVTPSATPN